MRAKPTLRTYSVQSLSELYPYLADPFTSALDKYTHSGGFSAGVLLGRPLLKQWRSIAGGLVACRAASLTPNTAALWCIVVSQRDGLCCNEMGCVATGWAVL